VARAWDDDGFRRRLLAEPEAVLREEGLEVPEGVAVRVVEDGATEGAEGVAYLRLPGKPEAEDLIEDDLSLPQDWSNGPMNIGPSRPNCGRSSRPNCNRSRPG
jgi:hypothetical protein